MRLNTFLLCFCYWFIIAIEAADLVDTVLMGEIYKHTVYTTEAILSIVMIIVNSYAIVTLCSYISPEPPADGREHKYDKKFDFLYKVFVSVGGVFFAEIPLLVARFQILAGGATRFLSMTFYLWLMKDILFIILITVSVVAIKLGNRPLQVPCKLAFDNTNVVFQPEKRDVYIVHEKRVRFKDPPESSELKPKPSQAPVVTEPIKSSLKQRNAVDENEYQSLKVLLSQNSLPPQNSPKDSPLLRHNVDGSPSLNRQPNVLDSPHTRLPDPNSQTCKLPSVSLMDETSSQSTGKGARSKHVMFVMDKDNSNNNIVDVNESMDSPL